jgi:Ribonuclease G/E
VAVSRRLLLDEGPGERRAVVLLDGQPERLWIERAGELAELMAGLRAVARVRRVDRGLKLAFLDLGEGAEAVLALTEATTATEGQAVEVEVTAPARPGKAATVRLMGPSAGEPRRLSAAQGLSERLQAVVPGQAVETGEAAREAADIAEDAALAAFHPLGGGASLSIETTRGLTAIDVDVGGAGGGDSLRAAARVNGLALAAAARLLRLKGLGGLVVFDLAGDGRDGEAVMKAARAAFAADMPGVVFGPVSKLGVFHLALPWRSAPVASRLTGPRATAQKLARLIEREAAQSVRVRARCAPEVAAAAAIPFAALRARLGPRIDLQADPALRPDDFEVRGE